MPKAVCIISGGLDSCGVASYWKEKQYELFLLTFDYGQRAKQEIKRAREIGKTLDVKEHEVVDISFMKEWYGASNVLTDETREMPSHFQSNIIVPIRNAVFLTIATAHAFAISAEVLAYGAHLTDQPYPDCRPEFAKSLAATLNLGDIDAIESKLHPPIESLEPRGCWNDKGRDAENLIQALGRIESFALGAVTSMERCSVASVNPVAIEERAFKQAGIKDKTEYG